MAPSIVQAAISFLLVGSASASAADLHFSGSAAVILERQAPGPVVPSPLPAKWAYQGCYTDQGVRTLGAAGYENTTAMTDLTCISFCDTKGYIYAGTEYSSQCFCDNIINSAGSVATDGRCNMPCSGNSTQVCGGPNGLTLFWSGKPPPAGPSTNPGTLGYGSFGCYTEGKTGRALQFNYPVPGGPMNITVAACVTQCKNAGYSLAGMEYGEECWCDNAISNGAVEAPGGLSECNKVCYGNTTEYCGQGDRLNVYKLGYSGSTSSVSSMVVSSTRSSTSSSRSTTSTSRSTTSTSRTTTSTSRATTSTSRSTTSSSRSTTSSSRSTTSSSRSTTSTSRSTTSTSRSTTSSSRTTTSSSRATTSSTRTSSSTTRSSTSSAPAAAQTLSRKQTVSGYSYLGCYTEGTNVRALSGAAFFDYTTMTLESCAASCAAFTYFGVEYGGECYCGNTLGAGSVSAPNQADCSFICPGNQYEYCGAGNRLEMYTKGAISSSSGAATSSRTSTGTGASASSTRTGSTSATPTPTGPSTVKSVNNYNHLGCYTEGTGVRALSPGAFADDTMTVESCAANCAAFTYFGLEYGRECYCGNTIAASAVAAPAGDCTQLCAGNPFQYCGAGDRLTMYIKNGTALPSSSTRTGTTSSATASQTSSATGLPAGWKYAGCYTEGTNGRALTKQQAGGPTNTVDNCIATCIGLGYSVAGLEFANQCFCDNFLYNGAALTGAARCNMPCAGNSSQICGAGDILSIYNTGELTVFSPPAAQKTNLPGKWSYVGCFTDNVNDKRALIWPVISTKPNNTATTCLNICAEYGYMSGGMEYGNECYCGDDANLKAIGSVQVAETECQVACSGNAAFFCGGGSRLSYYTWDATAPITTFNKPTGPAAGSYQYLIGGVVVPLITTGGINNKIVFMEKSGTGAPNTTGTYELDLAFINDVSKAWRPLHVKSDIFCSAGITLPDKAGRQLNIGGWAGASTYGVRVYWPDGSPGVPGVNDWQENVNEVSLLAGRWYPSALIMANASVLVLGGEVGSNSAPTPSCEILPRPPGGYAKYLDWLERTDPNNLYPFMFVLPTGGIFVVYYNEARILDEVTFDTVKTLPNLPGSVINPLAGRTYPLEGTGVILPMYPPYSAPVTVLVCGGSANGNAMAIDNCVSTQPEVAAPKWAIERMPTQRVMSCMCALPDGTFLILNGATSGVAGFGLAENPNLGAVLYNPSLPPNNRMSIMANTIVARLYHSEAILLPDGRVLVSGSNPEDGKNPEEYRVEVFNPPYALSAAAAPSYTITNKDWTYGDNTIRLAAKIPSGNLGAVRVSMMAAVSSTHGNSMGQRTLFLTVSCTGTAAAATCTVTAPPTAHVAPPGWYQIFLLDGPKPGTASWIRIGGAIADRANIGNWPGTASFTMPGLGAVGT